MQGLQGGMHGEPQRMQASQQVFQDMGLGVGKSAINPQLNESVLADSLYRSVTERLQSGSGPANFSQVRGSPAWVTPFDPASRCSTSIWRHWRACQVQLSSTLGCAGITLSASVAHAH